MTVPSGGRRVVVGYDGRPGSSAVLERAVEAAGAEGVVFVVHAYPRLDAGLADAESTVSTLYGGTGGPLDRAAWEPEIIAGDPAEAIAAVAVARRADEIVVGTRRFGLARALHGGVAEDLIRLAGVTVTVVPRGVAPRAEAA
jgi:nucleotide-binding universal stress UspA family protein